MQTFLGKKVNPLDVHPDDIDIEDVAHGLSMTCRYGGHTKTFYSVSEHCVLVSRHVAPEFSREGLLHDVSEYLLGDMVRPLKYQPEMEQFRLAEKRIEETVIERFGLRPFSDKRVWGAVKNIDNRILLDEMAALMRYPHLYTEDAEGISSEDGGLHGLEPLGAKILAYPPAMAEVLFLTRFCQLFPEYKRDFEVLS